MTYGDLYLQARKVLAETEGFREAAIIARDLICTLGKITVEQFLSDRDREVPQAVSEMVLHGVERLLSGEPLAYILGEWEFYGLPLCITPDVLIPRDDSCAVTDLAIQQGLFLPKDPRILDLCTGSGCIGIAVASRLKDAKVTLVDVSREALTIARKNIARNRLGGRMSCLQLDVRTVPPEYLGKFDLIVSNPPYITGEEMRMLPASVSNFEPHLALFGGDDGLAFYRDILKNFSAFLKPGGYICFEFGCGQGNAVCDLLKDSGFSILERKNDNNGIERAVLAQLMGKG